MRINGIKGSSSRVFLAILYTSILWFTLDVLILALYSSLTEEGNGSTLKLPTNAEHQRNARGQEPAAYALSGEAGLDELQHDVLRHALKLRAEANRTLSAGRHAKRKPSRFSWGNNLRDTLLHSNNSKDYQQLNKGKTVENIAVDKRLLEDRGEMKREIEMLKKELNEFRGKYEENNEKNKLKFQDGKLRQSDKRYSDTRQRTGKGRIDNVQMVQKEKETEEKEKEEDDDDEEAGGRPRQETDGARNDELENVATPGTHLVRDIDVTSKPRDPNGPGENGAMVRTRPEDQGKVKIGWDHAYFNEYVSDMISVERSVPDVRHKWCKTKEYSNDLPRTSIIICFTEESWSTLLRTVHSVLNRSPPELITEVLLIDDFSQREYLKQPLDEYMEKFPKVKIVRLSKREGLIRARLIGAEMAQGPVLTFLDSHVECNVGWLEPLLQRIHDDKTNVVCPSIDSIDATSFQYVGSGATIIGAFSWEMKFTWNGIPDYEARRRDDETWPIRSPAMAGGLFSIDKEFFYRLGTYDPGFDIWGAENLELSFKIWMCGGSLEIIPCSRVAHIFRKQQPYKFPDGNMKTFMRNTMRLVAVWVDEPYREIFYSLRPQLMGQEYGDVSDRIKLRQELQCHNFQWYLDNVYPALKVPDTKVRARGEVRNAATLMCLDSMGKGILGVFPCHGEGNNQAFSLSWKDVLQHKNKCLTKTKIPGQLVMLGCSLASTAKIIHTRGQTMQDASTGKCLDLNADRTMAVFNHCDGSNAQRWTFTRYFDRTGRALPK